MMLCLCTLQLAALEKASQILSGLGEESGGKSTYKLKASGCNDLSPSATS